MASLYRLALLKAPSRRLVSASFSHSSILSSATLSSRPFETPGAPEIFDIFDAPVRLRERNTTKESLKTVHTNSTSMSKVGPLHSKSIYSDALGLPWSLPPPVTFDGPARPPHIPPSILKKRRLQRRHSTHSSRGVHGSSVVSYSIFMPQSPPIYRLFDGPSRITRYQYPMPQNERSPFTYVSLAICLSSAFGWLVFKDNLDLQRQSKVTSP